MQLTDVSRTAIATLRCRAVESKKSRPIIHDPMAEYCLDGFLSQVSGEEQEHVIKGKLSRALINHIVIRAKKYDSIVNEFVFRNPHCTVVNLGCGFDTRYWRIDNRNCRYIELDLPEVIELKRGILKSKIDYELLGCSVFDTSWMDSVTQGGNRNILLLAEGLFMYLNREDVIHLFNTFAGRFNHSRIMLEVVTEKYTRGFWKRIVGMKMKRELGLDAGYNFGIKNARELESYAEGIKVIEEWSFIEDPDVHPRIYKYLGFSRTQWTVIAAINENQ